MLQGRYNLNCNSGYKNCPGCFSRLLLGRFSKMMLYNLETSKKFLVDTLQITNVWFSFLGFGYNFGGKQNECLKMDI